jgi:hypothetical protein
MIDFVWLETRATHIYSFAVVVVPGLLQTPAYAQKLLQINEPGATPEQIERWLELRITRQQVLDGDDPPHLSVILDEAVLHREIGAPETMATQLRRLAQCATKPRMDIRVLPFRENTPASTYGSFEVFELPTPFPEVAYTESMAGALYVESPDTERFLRTYDGHKTMAFRPADSAEPISTIAEKWQ